MREAKPGFWSCCSLGNGKGRFGTWPESADALLNCWTCSNISLQKMREPKAVPHEYLSALGFQDITVVAPYLALNYNFGSGDGVHKLLLYMPALLLGHLFCCSKHNTVKCPYN